MWTTIPKGVILKVIYYRHICFLENGTCLYSTTTRQPNEVSRSFATIIRTGKIKVETSEEKIISCGTYTINRSTVNVKIPLPHTTNYFELAIQQGRRNNMLSLMKHVSFCFTYSGEQMETEMKVPSISDHSFEFSR